MRVGVYIDGFNLYYAGRDRFGGDSRWRWLDMRGFVQRAITKWWPDATVSRIVYCTARVDAPTTPTKYRDQETYLFALSESGSVDWIEYGHFIDHRIVRPLAMSNGRKAPRHVSPGWPMKVKGGGGEHIHDATFMVSVADREEKGSDVNLATHALLDAVDGMVDAVVLVSNDSDLALPLSRLRDRGYPTGVLNPRDNDVAGRLRPDKKFLGSGVHWFERAESNDYLANQLPDPAGSGRSKPLHW